MAAIKTLFEDAVVKNISTSGGGGATSEPGLPSGLPGRSGGGIPEVVRDKITAKPGNRVPGENFWVIKK